MAATENNIETQRNGIVVILWIDSTFGMEMPLRRIPLHFTWGCARTSAIHICTPDTPFFRFRRSMMAMQASQRQRLRIKFHVGGPVELRYALQSYGIPTENIPMTWSGTIKDSYLKNWMRLRKAIEEDRESSRLKMRQFHPSGFQPVGESSLSFKSAMSHVVECPNMNDVVFRQGTSLYCHPGNVRFRSMIESSVIKLRATTENNPFDPSQNPIKSDDDTSISSSMLLAVPVSTFVTEIMDQIINKNNGRVLVWTSNHNNQRYGCWCTITKETQIVSKIEYIVREYIRGGGSGGGGTSPQVMTVSGAESQRSNHQTSESSTSIFRFEGGRESTMQSLSAVTSNNLPGSATSVAAATSNKRAKISSSDATNDAMTSNNEGNSSSDDETCQLFCKF